MTSPVPIRVFARHIQLSQRHWTALFGEEATPTSLMPLTSTLTACAEVVEVTVENTVLASVRVVLPFRENTHVALLRRDFAQFGAALPETAFTPCGIACRVEGPRGTVILADSVEFHPRHVAVQDNDPRFASKQAHTTLQTQGDRPRDFSEVTLRFNTQIDETALMLDVDDTQSTSLGRSTAAVAILSDSDAPSNGEKSSEQQ